MGRGAVLTNSLFSLCSICWTVVNCCLCFRVFVRMLPLDYFDPFLLSHSVMSDTLWCHGLPISPSMEFLLFFLSSIMRQKCLLPSRMSFEIMVGKYLFHWELTWVCIQWMFSWLCLSNLGTLNLIWILCGCSFLF